MALKFIATLLLCWRLLSVAICAYSYVWCHRTPWVPLVLLLATSYTARISRTHTAHRAYEHEADCVHVAFLSQLLAPSSSSAPEEPLACLDVKAVPAAYPLDEQKLGYFRCIYI